MRLRSVGVRKASDTASRQQREGPGTTATTLKNGKRRIMRNMGPNLPR